MAFAVSQQLNRYYNLYKNIDVTFSKEVVSTLNFEPKQVFVRCSGGQWPCIINSASMTKAKIICGKKSGFLDRLRSGVTSVNIDAVPRRCLIRDLSFSGAKILLVGIANFLVNKEVVLRFAFDDPQSVFGIKGRAIRTEPVEGRKDLVALAVQYYPKNIPMMYKMYLNKYFSVVRKPASDGFGDDFLEDVAPSSVSAALPTDINAQPLTPPQAAFEPEHPLE